VQDSAGNTAEVTDTILKDTVTDVEIDPLVVIDDKVHTVTGTGEAGSTITLTIDGTSVDVTVGEDGNWSYTPDTPLTVDSTEITIEAGAVDPYGNTQDTSRSIANLTVTDQEAG